MVRSHQFAGAVILGVLLSMGCTTSSTPAPAKTSGSSSATSENTGSEASGESGSKGSGTKGAEAKTAYWEDYPDVPKIEIMAEVDGIKIPRMPPNNETLSLAGPIPADVDNEWAKSRPSQPVSGDAISIRFNSEPRVLNPITETSAVQTYIMQYVNEGLARQNPETFEYEPGIAKKWVVEDSIKLSPDYPGRERRVALKDGEAKASFEINYEVAPPVNGKPAESKTISLVTSNKEGQPQGGAWVGIYPVGRILGASTTGYHYWSDSNGQLDVGGFPAGKYVVKTGDEIFGQSEPGEDGSLIVKPGTEENPLKEALTLKKDEWQDVQAKTYTTFYLRDDVKWSDGVPFTTRDIEFGYALLNSPYVDGDSIRTYYSDLVECTALGTHTIRLRYRQQYFKAHEFSYGISAFSPPIHFFEAIFKENGRELTLAPLTPQEEAAKNMISARGQEFGKFFNTDDRYNRKPLGTGPYIVDKWERGDRVELVRNPHYWEPAKAGHLDRIIFKFIIDQVSAMAAMKAGEIDFFFDMSAEQFFEDWPTLDKETRETYVRGMWFSPMFSYIGWNQLATPFKDRRVRIALTMLFDRQDFVDKKLHNAGVVVSGTQYLFGPGYDREVLPIAYDPEAARELLTEAGWIDSDNDGILDKNGEKFQVLLRLPKGKPVNEQMCEIMQKNFKSVGIDMQIQTMEWASFIEKLRAKECDAVALRWAMPIESDPFQIWHSSEAAREKRGSNTISFSNPLADELIEMLRVTLDENKRKRIHQSFHRVIDSEQPYMFLWIPKEFGAYHKRFRNVKWYRLRPGFDLSEWYVPKDEQVHK
ncbi:ABC transporter substrate-binding protein [Schlesneria sp. DSM 10557]|uniref:ABC transporter substrate-binding protein n=1 Tax=Schlesneria sp. DSM 10557 TaxID=3044399 RepID=UPI0035A00AD9